MRSGIFRTILLSTVATLPVTTALAQVPVLPTEGAFVAGAGSIGRSGAVMTIDQTTARGVVNWKDFSIGQGGTVQVNNGAGATLNRVTGGNLSQILGTLKATGSLYLINPQGVVIGESGVVVTGGRFAASTLDVLNEHFMAGGSLVFKGESTGSVTNLGKISSTGGDVVLIAREVVNKGRISAPKGTAALASGTEVLLSEGGADGERVLVRVGTAGGKVETSGLVEAATAELKAAGGNVYALAGNNGGLVRATGLEARGGRVMLTAAGGNVTISGTVEAKTAAGDGGTIAVTATAATTGTGAKAAATGGMVMHTGTLSADGGRGGSVAVRGNRVSNQGRVSANGSAGAGGTVAVEFGKAYIAPSNSTLSARGATRGGSVSVTGTQADSTLFSSGRHEAAGGQEGGSVDLFASAVTLVDASADASGGVQGGSIRVGGDYQGSGAMPKAATTRVSPTTTLQADATGPAGDGGRIIVWSEGATDYYGTASARAGAQGGNGGLIEVSSRDTLTFAGTADASAPAGTGGLLLLDPKNIVVSTVDSGYPSFQLVDPNPVAGNEFGSVVKALASGNVVVASPGDDFNGTDAGAVYLFNGLTGALISTLNGSAGDGGISDSVQVIPLSNGNFLVSNPYWANGTVYGAGFLTWGSGVTGVSGVVSAANSLVGTAESDQVGSGGVLTLANGNFLVRSTHWSESQGAVTWGNGTAGITGPVTAANSLVGSTSGDKVGEGNNNVMTLASGNYLVRSIYWSSGTGTAAMTGAVTWGSGTAGVAGVVSASNSLLGAGGGGIVTLSNGNYVVRSPDWRNGTATSVGAVTWGSGTAGVAGVVSASNSLVGSSQNDRVGLSATVLSNGNYVVGSYSWKNGAATSAGAVTWGDGTAGRVGVVSAGNSLVGTTANDQVGNKVTALANGNYVVSSTAWSNGGAASAGAVTWGDGTAGRIGEVSVSNSLVGTTANDYVGAYVTPLSNGNYVVGSPYWANGGAAAAGAATWGSGTAGVAGVVSAGNSLVGSTANEQVGQSTTPLSNGHYLAGSTSWQNGLITKAGLIAWGDGTAGLTGVISAANSLVGTTADAAIGSRVTPLRNGAYLIVSESWSDGTATSAGAVYWGSGTGAISGSLSSSNSLVGSSNNDKVGGGIVLMLDSGNYLVVSTTWNNGAAASAGAVTWGNGTAGVTGIVSAANSLVGTSANDKSGGNILRLANGNYLVMTPTWNNGAAASAGAVTWGSGTTGVTGEISSSNSLVGSSSGDRIGVSSYTLLSNGNYVLRSTTWTNGAAASAGAVTWGSGTAGVTGVVSAANSLVGTATNDAVGSNSTVLPDGNYLVTSFYWANGTATKAGAVTWGSGTAGVAGAVSAANSVVGSQANAWLGSGTPVATPGGMAFVGSSGEGTGGRVYTVLPASAPTYAMNAGQTVTIDPSLIVAMLSRGTAVALQASNDITVDSAITANNPSGDGGALTLQAGRSILIDANITTDNGNLTLIGNDLAANGVVDAHRDSGNAVITMAGGTTIDAGTGAVSIELRPGTGKTNSGSGTITLDAVTAGTLSVLNQGITPNSGITLLGGALAASGTGDALVLAADNGVFNNSGSATLSAAGGRFLIYSADQPGTTLGGVTGGILTGKTYANYAPASVTETGDQILYGNGITTPAPPPPPVPPPVVTPPTVETPVVVAPPVVTPPVVTPPVVTPPVVTPPVVVSPPVVTPPVPPVVVETPTVTTPSVPPPVAVAPTAPPTVVVPPPTTVIGGTAAAGTASPGAFNGGVVLAPAASFVNTVRPPAAPASGGTAAVVATTAAPGASGARAEGGIVTVQVSTAAPADGGAAQAAPSGRVEASVNAGGFQVVYSQPAASAASGGGSASADGGSGGGGAMAGASSFSTFRADEQPAVAIVADRNASSTSGQAADEKNAQ